MITDKDASLSIANPHPEGLNGGQKLGLTLGIVGVGILFLAFFGVNLNALLFLWISLISML